MPITFNLDDKDAQRVLGNIRKGINNFKPALEEVTGMQLAEVEKQFASEGSNIMGSKWNKLKKGTVNARIRAGFGASPILTASGRMRRANRKKAVTKNKAEIGNDTKYFKYAQLGTKFMKPRQVYGHSVKMIKRTMEIVSNYIVKIAKAK